MQEAGLDSDSDEDLFSGIQDPFEVRGRQCMRGRDKSQHRQPIAVRWCSAFNYIACAAPSWPSARAHGHPQRLSKILATHDHLDNELLGVSVLQVSIEQLVAHTLLSRENSIILAVMHSLAGQNHHSATTQQR
jgi:hypothetical protein